MDAELTVDLDALTANLAVVRGEAGGAEVAAVVKADAYGLGCAPVARRLYAEGVRAFYVARVAEGEALRRALGAARASTVYVFDGCPDGCAERLRAAGLTPVLNSVAQAEAWGAAGGGRCALHVDTGMNRLGLRPEEARALVGSPDRMRRLDVDVVLSHLAHAGEPGHPANARQLAAFREVRAWFPEARASLSATAGMFLGPEYRWDQVRPGIALYGGGPFGRPDPRLAAMATLTAPVLQVRAVWPGEGIGYDGAFVAERPMRVAILAAGYVDGGLRRPQPGGYGMLRGVKRPFVGRVSMDLTAVDVTDAPDCRPGDRIELLGANALLDEVAAAQGDIAHEVLTRLSARPERRYVGEVA